MIQLRFDNLHTDMIRIESWSDAILRIVGDFEISVDDSVLYREVEFCLVELAYQLHHWLLCAPTLAPSDFEYNSMESEANPMLWFRRVGDTWFVGAQGQEAESPLEVRYSDLVDAARSYLVRLDVNVDATLGVKLLPVLVDVGRTMTQ